MQSETTKACVRAKFDHFSRERGEGAVICQNVWKIYPDQTKRKRESVKVENGIIQKNLSKEEAFQKFGRVVGVADVSFSVSSGETFCIMGLSGSGKSTLLRHLNRLIEPTSGWIWINNQNLGEMGKRALANFRAKNISMVFQESGLWPHRTVMQNITFGPEIQGVPKKVRRKLGEEMLQLVKLDGWADRYPEELSGGMKQRVSLARALCNDPDILLLDEPFSALDPLIREEMQLEFKRIATKVKKTVVFITHDLQEAIELGDRIAIMKDGSFRQVGTAEEIVLNPLDEYISNFVRQVPRFEYIKAQDLMECLQNLETRKNFLSNNAPKVQKSATLGAIIDISSETKHPLLVEDDNGTVVGVITKARLIEGISSALKAKRKTA